MVAVLAAAAILAGCGVRSGPALRDVPPHGWSISVVVDEPFTDGFEVLQIGDGGGDVELEQVEVLGTDALEVVGFQVAGPTRSLGAVQFFAAFPPGQDPHPDRLGWLADLEPIMSEPPFVVEEHEFGTELLLGLVATELGRHERTGLRLHYSRDGVSRTEDIPAELVVCVVTEAEFTAHGDCPLEDPDATTTDRDGPG